MRKESQEHYFLLFSLKKPVNRTVAASSLISKGSLLTCLYWLLLISAVELYLYWLYLYVVLDDCTSIENWVIKDRQLLILFTLRNVVRFFMSISFSWSFESLRAIHAFEWLFPCVDSLMLNPIPISQKSFMAKRTFKWLDTRKDVNWFHM